MYKAKVIRLSVLGTHVLKKTSKLNVGLALSRCSKSWGMWWPPGVYTRLHSFASKCPFGFSESLHKGPTKVASSL